MSGKALGVISRLLVPKRQEVAAKSLAKGNNMNPQPIINLPRKTLPAKVRVYCNYLLK
jgi:hypothetical protein